MIRELVSKKKEFRIKILRLTEPIFLILCGFYLATQVLQITMFRMEIPKWFDLMLTVYLNLAVVVRILVQLDNKLVWFGIITYLIYNMSWEVNSFPGIALLTLGCIGINYNKILKTYLISVGSIVCAAILAALSGGIENLVYMKGGYLRSSMGICYPTDYAAIVLFLLCTLWVYWKALPDEISIFLALFSLWLSSYIVRSRTSMICSLVFVLLVLYKLFETWIVEKKERFIWIKSFMNAVILVEFPVLALIMSFLMWAYSREYTFALVADRLLTNRLAWAYTALTKNGISALGSPLSEKGAGSTTFFVQDYFFVDSSYPRILLLYGVAIFILCCVLWIVTTKRALTSRDRRLVLTLALIAFHAISEHHFIQVYYNIFLILPFADFSNNEIDDKKISKDFLLLRKIISCLSAGLIVLSFPVILSYLKIWVIYCRNDWQLMIAVLLILWSSLLLIWGSGRVVASIRYQYIEKKRTSIIVVGTLLSFAIIAVAGNRAVNKAISAYDDSIRNETSAILTILKGADGKVYVSRLGEVYKREFKNISRGIFDYEDIARLKNVTVIIDREKDSPIFTNTGFLYTPISDVHAIYTNDFGVKKALQDTGYVLTSFCTAVHSCSNTKEYNNSVNLHSGDYTVSFPLEINVEPYDEDYELCRLCVTAMNGLKTLREVQVYRSWFNENGKLKADVKFKTADYAGVQFRVAKTSGYEIKTGDITWHRSPEYDIHPAYDKGHRKIREDYYDLKGKPVMNKEGFASVKYYYNDQGLVDELRYFDLDMRPVNTKDGFAIVRRSHNVLKQRIREEYYNTDDEPVILPEGFSKREWDYTIYNEPLEMRFYDTIGNPVITSYGYAKLKREYLDKKGIRDSYFGTDDAAILNKEGYAGLIKTFEKDKNSTGVNYLGLSGETVEDIYGCAMVITENNVEDNIKKETYYDLNGAPVMLTSGYASLERLYDLSGDVWKYRLYDVDGKLIRECSELENENIENPATPDYPNPHKIDNEEYTTNSEEM